MEDKNQNVQQAAEILNEGLDQQIITAAETGNIEYLKELLDANPHLVNVIDEDGYTPLHRASYNDHSEVAKELLKRGANLHAKTKDGWQPLHCASHWNCFKVVALLLHAGADVNAVTEGGQTPLHFAGIHRSAWETTSLLLSMPHLDFRIVNAVGDTAFEIAKRNSLQCNLFKVTEDKINKI